MNPDEIAEANNQLTDIICNPTAQVVVCGQFPEDSSTVQNFKEISEDQRLYSKKQLQKAYKKGKKQRPDTE